MTVSRRAEKEYLGEIPVWDSISKKSFKASDNYFCVMVPEKKIKILINDLARFYQVSHGAGIFSVCQLLSNLLNEQALINEQGYFINIISGSFASVPFFFSIAGLSSLGGMLCADSIEDSRKLVQKQNFPRVLLG